MQLSWDDIQANAVRFSKRWENARREKADEQPFIIEFIGVFGVDDPVKAGERQKEVKVPGKSTKWIDYFWKNKIAVEMKSRGEDMDKGYWQLKERYMDNIPPEDLPDLWLVCDFENFHLRRLSTKEVFKFKLKDLHKKVRLFANIAGYETERVRDGQIEVNVKAAEKMARLYDALRGHGYEGHDLEVYLVRLLFCLFADDTGIFPKDSLFRYIEQSRPDGTDLTERIGKLFDILNMPPEIRAKRTLLSDELKQFRYINGRLFDKTLPMADFNAKMRQILLDCLNFDWNTISPAIFGAMFQGVMDKDKRREMGAHYTSEENIEKLINPLFMDGLWQEFDKVKTDPAALDRFHNKVSRLKFLDPACGCGNFLIVTYGKLRELELEILKMKIGSNQLVMDISDYLKVSVEQFYGIEYEEFPCQIAQVGMWLIDHQMNLRVSEQFGIYFARLPLTQGAAVVHGNALRLDWEDIVPKGELSYIMGNPPFVGYPHQTKSQKEDMANIFPKNKNLDYVCAWYKKAADVMQGTLIKAAFVSTNSISQGEQPNILWKLLMNQGIYINFGVPSFVWSNEAKGKAAVHCVIVGFSYQKTEPNINQYLHEAPTVFIEKRVKPICDAPIMSKGSQPTCGGYFMLSPEERDELLAKYPEASKWVKRYISGDDFINNKLRYCLWLVGVSPSDLRKVPPIIERINKVRETRSESTKKATQKQAETPTLFTEIRQPNTDYITIPMISSERRKYIPIDYMPKDVIASNLVFIVPNASLYHFGVLTSNVHMAWMRAVGGKLKSDYIYSNTIVYNNFPWPNATDDKKTQIEKLAQAILDARANYPDSSLADLYDPLTTPPDLLKAHRTLDSAVMKLYNFPVKKDFSEADCVAALMELYQDLTNNANPELK